MPTAVLLYSYYQALYLVFRWQHAPPAVTFRGKEVGNIRGDACSSEGGFATGGTATVSRGEGFENSIDVQREHNVRTVLPW